MWPRLALALVLLLLPSLAHAVILVTPPGITCADDPRFVAHPPIVGLDYCFQSTTNDLRRWSGVVWEGIPAPVSAGVSALNGMSGALTIQPVPDETTVTLGLSTIFVGTVQNIAVTSTPIFKNEFLTDLTTVSTKCVQYNGVTGFSLATDPCGGGGGGGVTSINTTATGAVNLLPTTNRVSVTTVGSNITLSAPQDLAPSSTVTFNAVTATTMNTTSLAATSITTNTLTATGRVAGLLCDTGGQVFNITCPPFNASPSASATANRIAIQAAIDAANAVGGTIYCPGGNFPVDAPGLNVSALVVPYFKLRFQGPASAVTGTACRFTYKSSTGSLFTGPVNDFTVENMGLFYDSLFYRGTLLNIGGFCPTPSAFIHLNGVQIGGINGPSFTGNTHTSAVIDGIAPNTTGLSSGMVVVGPGVPSGATILTVDSPTQITLISPTTTTRTGITFLTGTGAAALIDLRCAYHVKIERFTMYGAEIGIFGANSLATDFTNTIRITDGQFVFPFTDTPIRMGGTAWTMQNVSCEPTSQDGLSLGCAIVTPVGVQGLALHGNWLADNGGALAAGTFINASSGAISGGSFQGNYCDVNLPGATCYNLGASTNVVINDFIRGGTGSPGSGYGVIMDSATNVTLLSGPVGTTRYSGFPAGVSLVNTGDEWKMGPRLVLGAAGIFTVGSTNYTLGLKQTTTNNGVVLQASSNDCYGYFFHDGARFRFGASYQATCPNTYTPLSFESQFTERMRVEVSGTVTVAPAGSIFLDSLPASVGPFRVVAATGSQTNIVAQAFGNVQGAFVGLSANGTPGARLPKLANQALVALIGAGAYDATNYSTSQASYGCFAAENFSVSALGTFCTVGVTPLGSTILTEAMRWTGITGGAGYRVQMTPTNAAPSFVNSHPFYINATTSGTRTGGAVPASYAAVIAALNYPGLLVYNNDSSVGTGSSLGFNQNVTGLFVANELGGFDGAGTALGGAYFVNSTTSGERVATSGSIFVEAANPSGAYGVNGFAGRTVNVAGLMIAGLFEINNATATAAGNQGVQSQNIHNFLHATQLGDAALSAIVRTGTVGGNPDAEAWVDAFRASTDGTAANARFRVLNDGRVYLLPTTASVDAFSIFAPSGSNGANIKLAEAGSQIKFIRNRGGSLEVMNGSYSTILFAIGDAGSLTTVGSAGLSVTKTVRASGGAADCTLVYTNGLLTGGSC